VRVLGWWKTAGFDGVIADGAVRSGKTLCMSLGFILWAMSPFDGQNFAICGKTIGSAERNIMGWLRQIYARPATRQTLALGRTVIAERAKFLERS